ncbi:MAG: miniconductance mechanosensitive channel [Bradymonadia bacterium]|jgi:miniconductance mechanosensitive channel
MMAEPLSATDDLFPATNVDLPGWLSDTLGFLPETAWLHGLVAFGILFFVAWLTHRLTRWVLLRAIRPMVKKSRTQWDDFLLERSVFARLAWLTPLAVFYLGAPALLRAGELEDFIQRVALAAIVIVVARALASLLTAANDIYEALVFAVATVLDQSPWGFLSGIGAATAVLLLIFKDTILGLVASVQLSTYDMVREGDWISLPQFGADGDVVDISLHTVRVQNWDKTISTIPTYKLIEQSFKNWRGMSESGGRRIKRDLRIDLGSIRFLDKEEVLRFEGIDLLRTYMAEKRAAVEQTNADRPAGTLETNFRRLSNVGTFRAYVERYLHDRGDLRDDMTFLVRQLPADELGLPLEIYAFTNTTEWGEYEDIQADIFDHLLAVAPEFGLRIFQLPASNDLREAIASR